MDPPRPLRLSDTQYDEGLVELVQRTYDIMREYAQDRLEHQLEVPQVTTTYLDRYIALVDDFQSRVSEPAPLTDALTLVRCFAAYPLLPDSRVGPVHVRRVLDWVQHADPGWEPSDVARLLQTPNLSTCTGFWAYIAECVCCGRLDVAGAAVHQLDAEADSDPVLASLVRGLEAVFESYPWTSQSEFLWRQWRKNAINLHSQATAHPAATTYPSVQKVTGVLMGQISAIKAAAASWYACIGGLYMYADPSPDLLPVHFQQAENEPDLTLDWEEGCVNIFEDRLAAALVNLERLNLSASVVMSEFCFQRGLLTDYGVTTESQPSFRELLALRFAQKCLGEPSLLEIGLELLGNMATTHAKRYAAELLPQLASRSPSAAPQALALADQLGLPEVASKISRVAAEHDLANGSFIDAVAAFYEAGDFARCRDTAWDMFRQSLLRRKPIGDPVGLDILRQPPHLSQLPSTVLDCLAPVAVLVSILDGYDEAGEATENALASLLSLPEPPLLFWPLLVALIADSGTASFSTRTVVLLMNALDQWDDAPADIKHEGAKLIRDAQSLPEWKPLFADSFSIDETVWMLRRRLANMVL